MSFSDINPYFLMAVAGFFTGLGNVAGQWFYKKFIQPRFNHINKVFNGGKKNERRKKT